MIPNTACVGAMLERGSKVFVNAECSEPEASPSPSKSAGQFSGGQRSKNLPHIGLHFAWRRMRVVERHPKFWSAPFDIAIGDVALCNRVQQADTVACLPEARFFKKRRWE